MKEGKKVKRLDVRYLIKGFVTGVCLYNGIFHFNLMLLLCGILMICEMYMDYKEDTNGKF